MFSHALLAFAFATTDSTAPPSLDSLLARARRAAHRPATALRGYDAQGETELSLLLNTPADLPGAVAGTRAGTMEVAAIVEQLASRVAWRGDGTYAQHVIGYRSQALQLSYSTLSLFRHAVVVPVLYGDRWWLFYAADTVGSGAKRRPPSALVSPFGLDGGSTYDFSGGDTVATLMVGTRRIPLARIVVSPKPDLPPGRLAVEGEVVVDAERGDIVRLRGRVIGRAAPSATGDTTPRRRSLARRIAGSTAGLAGVVVAGYVEFENQEIDGRWWLPRAQRIELQVQTGMGDGRAVLRSVSRFRDVRAEAARDTTLAGDARLGQPSAPMPMTFAAGDSLRAHRAWQREIGRGTGEVMATDFDDVAPIRLRRDGPPVLRPQLRRPTEFVRYDKVQGFYLGFGAQWRARDLAPGLQVRGNAGLATAERTARGNVEATLDRGANVWLARVERSLASTNDLVSPYAELVGIGGFFGLDDADYVHRDRVQAGWTRLLDDRAGAALRVELGWGRDAPRANNVGGGPFSRRTFRPNRPADGGHYVSTLVSLDVGRAVLSQGAQSGIGAQLSVERGDGELTFTRLDARVVTRRQWGPVVATGRVQGAALVGSDAPLQRLIELGGPPALPGAAYKAFTGTRGAVSRATLSYVLPILSQPLRFGELGLPALAPTPSIGVTAGFVESAPWALGRLSALGWAAGSQRVLGAVDVRMRFFGGGVSIGAGRAFYTGAPWRAVVSFGGDL
jgi:hypothetical protein